MTEHSEFQVVTLRDAQDDAFVNAWRELSEHARIANPFFDPDFCLPAMRRLGKSRVKLAVIRDYDGALIALAPFVVNRFAALGPRVAEIWTHDYIPLGTPLVRQGCENALEELMRGISNYSNAPVLALLFKGLNDFKPFSPSLQADVLFSYERAALHSALSGEAYRQTTLSKQRRQGLNRRYRRLAERTAHLGELHIELCNDSDLVPSRFETFMRVEKLGWKGGSKTALLNVDHDADFAREVAVGFSCRQACYVATLRAGDTVLAALILFKINGVFFSWKTSFDETYAECSPGSQILSRFVDPLMGHGDELMLDSCSAPDNVLANAIWGERVHVQNVLFVPHTLKTAGMTIRSLLTLGHKARRTAKKLIKRS